MSRAAFDLQRLQPSGCAEGGRTEGEPRQRRCPAPRGLSGLPEGRQGLSSACSLMGAGGCERNFPAPSTPRSRLAAGGRCLPDGTHRGKRGGLLCSRHLPGPMWSPAVVPARLTKLCVLRWDKTQDQSKETGIEDASVIVSSKSELWRSDF